MIDMEEKKKGEGDPRFRCHEYWGFSSMFILHYLGDHTVFKGFKHRNSKVKVKPFVTSAPHVKEKVNYFSYTVYIITLA